MDYLKIGSEEKTESSKYQISLTDKRNKNLDLKNHPRVNRFFDTLDEQKNFINLFETSILDFGGEIIQRPQISHPYFECFDVLDPQGIVHYNLTVYR